MLVTLISTKIMKVLGKSRPLDPIIIRINSNNSLNPIATP